MCVFCEIAKGNIPCGKVYEDDRTLAFYDLDPKAPTHVLVIPKEHIESAACITPENSGIVAHVYEVIARLSAELGLEGGFRVVTNSGADGGQTVGHLHFHLLAGRKLSWPPG